MAIDKLLITVLKVMKAPNQIYFAFRSSKKEGLQYVSVPYNPMPATYVNNPLWSACEGECINVLGGLLGDYFRKPVRPGQTEYAEIQCVNKLSIQVFHTDDYIHEDVCITFSETDLLFIYAAYGRVKKSSALPHKV